MTFQNEGQGGSGKPKQNAKRALRALGPKKYEHFFLAELLPVLYPHEQSHSLSLTHTPPQVRTHNINTPASTKDTRKTQVDKDLVIRSENPPGRPA